MKRLMKWIWIPIVVVVLVAGYFGYRYYQQRQYASTLRTLQTQPAAKGTLTASVSATGSLEARQSADLSFTLSGQVGTVSVKLGDHVDKGQVLAALDPGTLPQSVVQAQVDLVTDQNALNTLVTSDTVRANAELALANAQKAYDSAFTNYTYEVADNKKGALNKAKDWLATIRSHYNYIVDHHEAGWRGQIAIRQAYQQLIAAMQAVDALEYKYATTGNSGLALNPSTIAIVTGQYEVAKAALADAQAAYDRVKDGPNPDDVAAAKAKVAADQALIDEAELVAPFGGTVTAVNILPGDLTGSSVVAVSIADLSEMKVSVAVSEVDISSVAVGQPATLTFDAIADKTYQGAVTEVGLNPTISSGSVTYPVTVVVKDTSGALRQGMTAAVTVEVSRLDNVLLVPSRAVRTVGTQTTRRVVYVMRSGVLVPVSVTLGASNDTMSVVTGGGLKVGDAVVLNPPAAGSAAAPSSSFGVGGGGAFRGGGFIGGD